MPPSNMSIQTGSPSPLPTRHEDVKTQELPIGDSTMQIGDYAMPRAGKASDYSGKNDKK